MVFSYPPSGSAPALSGTHARARSNVYQHISKGILRGLTRRGGLRSQRGGLAVALNGALLAADGRLHARNREQAHIPPPPNTPNRPL